MFRISFYITFLTLLPSSLCGYALDNRNDSKQSEISCLTETESKYNSGGFSWIKVTRKSVDGKTCVAVKNLNGEYIIPFEAGLTRVRYSKNCFFGKKGKTEGVYLQYGEEIISPDLGYVFIVPHPDKKIGQYYSAKDSLGRISLYDSGGELLISKERGYTSAGISDNFGSARHYYVKKGDFEGICDMDGNEVIPPDKYTYAYPVLNHILVKIGKSEGVCTPDGKEIISPERGYTSIASQGQLGYTIVKNGSKGACNPYGKEIVPVDMGYENVDFHDNNYLFAKKGEFYSVYDIEGNNLIPISRKYTKIDPPFLGPYFKVYKDGNVGACDVSGNEILAPIYKEVVLNKGVMHYQKADGNWVATDITLK